jgi:(p)ppGpp synthase/HD superfamily hydrolase
MINFKETKPLKDYDSVSLAEMLRTHFVENFPLADVQRLGDAIQVASYLHRTDIRRGNRGDLPNPPYIEHPLRVAVRLFKYFGVKDASTIIAAILHDTVEDHPWEFADFEGVYRSNMTDEYMARVRALEFIADHFGFVTASLVALVSNPLFSGEGGKEAKIAAYQKHVNHAVEGSPQALIIKISDFVDNAGSLHHHYEYGDKKVQYFIDRYEALIPIYLNAIDKHDSAGVFEPISAATRVNQVADQFNMFRSAI